MVRQGRDRNFRKKGGRKSRDLVPLNCYIFLLVLNFCMCIIHICITKIIQYLFLPICALGQESTIFNSLQEAVDVLTRSSAGRRLLLYILKVGCGYPHQILHI